MKLLTSLLLYFAGIIFCQSEFRTYAQSAEFPNFKSGALKGISVSRNDLFDGNSLWAYMNGGADLYIEYGFEKLNVLEFQWKGIKWKAEIFRMKDVQSAFGIFSFSRHKCIVNDSLPSNYCLHPAQLGFYSSRFFVSVSAIEKQNKSVETELVQIADELTNQMDKTLAELPMPLQSPVLKPFITDLKLMKGRLAVNNAASDYADFIENCGDFSLYLLPVKQGKDVFNLGFLSTKSDSGIEKFCAASGYLLPTEMGSISQLSSDGGEKICKWVGPGQIEFISFPLSSPASGWYSGLIE